MSFLVVVKMLTPCQMHDVQLTSLNYLIFLFYGAVSYAG